ncbi:hypothetical protein ACQKOA_23065 [Bacillus mobilis]|uniref:hypothetical protein n=1 Tax=Bacillus mobilis TaxID=2026190 RepID=UPI003D058B60
MNTREELLQELRTVLPKCLKVEEYSDLIDRTRSRFKTLPILFSDNLESYNIGGRELFKGVFAIILIVVYWTLIFTITSAIDSWLGFAGAALGIPIALILSGLTANRISYPFYKILAKKVNAPVKEYNEKIRPEVEKEAKDLRSAQNLLIDETLKWTVIPPKYLHSAIVKKFITYIENYQADTLKECVLRFEQEKQHNEMSKHLSNIQNQFGTVNSNLDNIGNAVHELNRTQQRINHSLEQVEYKTRNI